AHGAAFRLGADDGFTFRTVETDKGGAQHVRMAQTYKGIFVIGGELIVHLERDQVIGISGRFVADLDVPTAAAINADEAAASALSFLRNDHQNPRVAAGRQPVIFVDGENLGHLAIPVQVMSGGEDESLPIDLFVDAGSGQVLRAQALALSPTSTFGSPNVLRNPQFESGDNSDWQAYHFV